MQLDIKQSEQEQVLSRYLEFEIYIFAKKVHHYLASKLVTSVLSCVQLHYRREERDQPVEE